MYHETGPQLWTKWLTTCCSGRHCRSRQLCGDCMIYFDFLRCAGNKAIISGAATRGQPTRFTVLFFFYILAVNSRGIPRCIAQWTGVTLMSYIHCCQMLLIRQCKMRTVKLCFTTPRHHPDALRLSRKTVGVTCHHDFKLLLQYLSTVWRGYAKFSYFIMVQKGSTRLHAMQLFALKQSSATMVRFYRLISVDLMRQTVMSTDVFWC